MIKFIKPVKDTEGSDKPTPNEVRQTPVPPSPPTPTPVKRDSVPDFTEVLGENHHKGEVSDKAVPLDVKPHVVPQSDDTDPSPTAKKRGRPAGSGKGNSGKGKKSTSSASTNLTAEMLSRQIEGLHAMIDVAIPGSAIGKHKADLMGEAMYDVAMAFGIQMSEKFIALATFAATAAIVEFPVVQNAMNHFTQKRRNRQAVGQAQVQRHSGIPMGDSVNSSEKNSIPADNSEGFAHHMSNEVPMGDDINE